MWNGTATSCASTRRRVRSCITRCGRWWARWSRSVKADGALTILRGRWRRATAKLAARWRRRTVSIWSGWTIDGATEIAIEDPPVDGGERHEIAGRNVFVVLVHGRVDGAKLRHLTVIRDE